MSDIYGDVTSLAIEPVSIFYTINHGPSPFRLLYKLPCFKRLQPFIPPIIFDIMSQATYHLRPVSPSPSPTVATTSPASQSPPGKRPASTILPSPPMSNSSAARIRRPLSPSSLRG